MIGWMARRHHCKVERDWIVFTAGVVTALNYTVQAATEPGDGILVPGPVYGPFYHAVEDWGRVLVKCPLKNDALHYTFDFEFRAHTMFLNVSPELAGRTILCTAPSKTFNLAGIQASNIIIPGEALRQKYRAAVARNHGSSANSFVQAAVLGAYNDSEGWLDELLEYLDGNMALFCGTVERELPKLRVRRPEGTYMTWVDCSGLGLEPGALKRFFVDRCRLALSDGAGFGEEGADFMRFNLACPCATVEECLRRLKENCR